MSIARHTIFIAPKTTASKAKASSSDIESDLKKALGVARDPYEGEGRFENEKLYEALGRVEKLNVSVSYLFSMT